MHVPDFEITMMIEYCDCRSDRSAYGCTSNVSLWNPKWVDKVSDFKHLAHTCYKLLGSTWMR
jgi:hypothetical protein